MKKAFTMIELIFVIVILGILAAVALPKFIGVSKQAHKANVQSFVGTLNRTVGPTLWSQSISEGKGGSIANLASSEGADFLKQYIDIPKEIKSSSIDLSKCSSSGGTVASCDSSVAGFSCTITCIDGNATNAPEFNVTF